jgi:phytoene desaturase
VLLLGGHRGGGSPPAHHNIHFGPWWSEAFADLAAGRLTREPSLFVSAPSVTDPTLAPPGATAYSVIVPAPNTATACDWRRREAAYVHRIDERLASLGYPDLSRADVLHTTTPLGWQQAGYPAGTPFSAAHLFTQSGPFRPSTLSRSVDNLAYAGCGVQPGIGIPMVLLSGRLAAERIVGTA